MCSYVCKSTSIDLVRFVVLILSKVWAFLRNRRNISHRRLQDVVTRLWRPDLSSSFTLSRSCRCQYTMADEPFAGHHIRPLCNFDTAVGTQTQPAAPSSKRVAGQVARPFHAPCNRDDCISPSPFSVPVSRWPGAILLHDQQDCGHRCFNHSWTLWSGLFNTNHSCLCTPQLPVSYTTVHRVVVLTDSDVSTVI